MGGGAGVYLSGVGNVPQPAMGREGDNPYPKRHGPCLREGEATQEGSIKTAVNQA